MNDVKKAKSGIYLSRIGKCINGLPNFYLPINNCISLLNPQTNRIYYE